MKYDNEDLIKYYFACIENRICIDFLCIPIFSLFFLYNSMLRYLFLFSMIGIIDLIYNCIKLLILRFEIKNKNFLTSQIKIIHYHMVTHREGFRQSYHKVLYGYWIIAENIGKRKKYLYLIKNQNPNENKIIRQKFSKKICTIEYLPKTKIIIKIK